VGGEKKKKMQVSGEKQTILARVGGEGLYKDQSIFKVGEEKSAFGS